MSSKAAEDRTEYYRCAAKVKKKSEKLQRNSWKNFVTFLEHDTYKLRPKVYKIIHRIDTNYNKKVRLPKIKIEHTKKYFEEL